MNKETKIMVNHLIKMTDEYSAGMIIATLLDALEKFVSGVNERSLRKIEITLNDFYSESYEFPEENKDE